MKIVQSCKAVLVFFFFILSTQVSAQIGVMAGEAGCPGGSKEVFVHVDNEDRRNANYDSGWIGGSWSQGNTGLSFCEVSSANFPRVQQPYMVLYLGSCPSSSTHRVARIIDCENDNPVCYVTVNNIELANWPSASSGGTQSNYLGLDSYGYKGVTIRDVMFYQGDLALEFCYIPGGGSATAFPDFGVPYGVLANSFSSSQSSASGVIYMDDQDGNNIDRWFDTSRSPQYSGPRENRNYPGISGGYNTKFKLVKIIPGPPVVVTPPTPQPPECSNGQVINCNNGYKVCINGHWSSCM